MENTTDTFLHLMNSSIDDINGTFAYFSLIGPEYFKVYNIYLYLMIIFGVLGNIVVLVVFFYNPPSNTTDWFIFTITVCDFISSSINVPVYVTFTNGYWRFYGTTLICRLHMFISQSIVLSSSFLICGLALDRYLKVCRNLMSFTKVHARNSCVVISLLTTVLSTPAFVMHENRAGRCASIVMGTTLFVYYLLVFLIFIFATIIVVFSYCKVIKTVAASEANVARHTGNTYKSNNRNKLFDCCMSLRSKNKVAPSISAVSCNVSHREILVNTSSEQSVSSRNLGNLVIENDTIQVQRHIFTIAEGYTLAITGPSQPLERAGNSRTTSTLSSNNRIRQHKSSSKRTTKISFLVCSVFILSWIPPWLCFILASISNFTSNARVVKFMLFGRMTYLINGFSNPIIYTLLNKKFRTRILDILCRRR